MMMFFQLRKKIQNLKEVSRMGADAESLPARSTDRDMVLRSDEVAEGAHQVTDEDVSNLL